MATIYIVEIGRDRSIEPAGGFSYALANISPVNAAQAVEQADIASLRALPSKQRVQLMYEINASGALLRDKVVAVGLLNATHESIGEHQAQVEEGTDRVIAGTPQFVQELREKYGLPDLDLDSPLPEEIKDDIIQDVNAYVAEKLPVPEPPAHPEELAETEVAHYDPKNDDIAYSKDNVPNLGTAIGVILHELDHKSDIDYAIAYPKSEEAEVTAAALNLYGIGRFGYPFYRTNPLEANAFNQMNRFNRAFGLPVA